MVAGRRWDRHAGGSYNDKHIHHISAASARIYAEFNVPRRISARLVLQGEPDKHTRWGFTSTLRSIPTRGHPSNETLS